MAATFEEEGSQPVGISGGMVNMQGVARRLHMRHAMLHRHRETILFGRRYIVRREDGRCRLLRLAGRLYPGSSGSLVVEIGHPSIVSIGLDSRRDSGGGMLS